MTAGHFITLEGGEGSGKSTQLKLLAERLKAVGIDPVLTREPGGSIGADAIRALLVTGEPGRWDGMTEALLHFAARRDHLRQTVWPALDAGRWVICDRFTDSTLAYQGYGHGLDLGWIRQLQALAIGEFRSDLTLVLDIEPEIGLRRAMARAGKEDRYERMDLSFHQRLAQGFRKIVAEEPERCRLIDGAKSPVDVAQAVWQEVAFTFSLI